MLTDVASRALIFAAARTDRCCEVFRKEEPVRYHRAGVRVQSDPGSTGTWTFIAQESANGTSWSNTAGQPSTISVPPGGEAEFTMQKKLAWIRLIGRCSSAGPAKLTCQVFIPGSQVRPRLVQEHLSCDTYQEVTGYA